MIRQSLVIAGLFCMAAGAQDPTPDFRTHIKEAKTTSDAEIREFEAPPISSYTLESGDEITVETWGHPELSGHHVLGPDGRITIPVAGVLPVIGYTREGAEKAIASALGKYYSDLSIILRIDRYTSFRVYVLGRVATPGAIQFDSQPTILDVITRAGSLPVINNGEKTLLGRCAIIRGRDRMIWLDLTRLLSNGDLSLNIRLARNDLVYIPDSGTQLVYVLGQVSRPGALRLIPEMSFLDAFTQAGGATDDAASDKISVVRPSSGSNREFRLKDLLANPKEMNFALNEGDIIYVPQRPLGKLGYVLQKTSPLAGLAVIGSLLK